MDFITDMKTELLFSAIEESTASKLENDKSTIQDLLAQAVKMEQENRDRKLEKLLGGKE